MKDIIANLRSSIAYSKKPGNEGQCLANAKGIYRPVSEILTPTLKSLEGIEVLLTRLTALTYTPTSIDALEFRSALLEAIDTFNAEPNLQAASSAKSALRSVK